jgi:hypothetical protein
MNKKRLRLKITALMGVSALFAAYATATYGQAGIQKNQGPAPTSKKEAVAPAATDLPVKGTSATVGQVTKWIGSDNKALYLGDSIIAETGGKIGIGTAVPTSLLTVRGMIETTLGGYKFPDGTVQTTAARTGLEQVFHDATLRGDGTSRAPLGINPTSVLTSLNGYAGQVVLRPGRNITITPTGENSLTIDASGCSCTTVTDTTLQGNGTAAQPLGVAAPLNLNATFGDAITATATGNGSNGVSAQGGDSTFEAGAGVNARGGNGTSNGAGGAGVVAQGGGTFSDVAGPGVDATGGDADVGQGGVAVNGQGGHGFAFKGGDGLIGLGGSSTLGEGGDGIVARGNKGGPLQPDGLAGDFLGDVEADSFILSFGATIKIDHPLDPENRYLFHSSVESPDMKNIYDGNVVTNESGDAVVELPAYFESLNRDFRYQLTVIGTFAQAIVAEKIKGNRFAIKTNAPNVEVSWQVTGVRQDAWANQHRVRVEVEKNARERGSYLSPEAFGQPEEKSIHWVRHPDLMKQIKRQQLKDEKAKAERPMDH